MLIFAMPIKLKFISVGTVMVGAGFDVKGEKLSKIGHINVESTVSVIELNSGYPEGSWYAAVCRVFIQYAK